ncbi:nucleotidyltransferase domain-containing protein [Candidatus Woesearchaeota archaeon]|nr:nucleotidyltransferase domain-containing protein [Candidatus Woesearchaeota archaeon]
MKKLNKQTLNAVAYAQNALSFIFLDSSIDDLIKEIYLYGSAARGELGKDSDVDIFINCDAKKESIVEGVAKAALSRFYKSKDFDKWKFFKFDYAISFQAGELKTWQLRTSIMAEGVLLYSKKAEIMPAERKVLFTYELPKKKKQYLHFIRSLFGRKEKGYNDSGLLGEANGKKISANLIIVPKENQEKITGFMQKEKINYSMKEICIFE